MSRWFRIVRVLGLLTAVLVLAMMVIDAVAARWWEDGVSADDAVRVGLGLLLVVGLALGAWRPLAGGVLVLAGAGLQLVPAIREGSAGPAEFFPVTVALLGIAYVVQGWTQTRRQSARLSRSRA